MVAIGLEGKCVIALVSDLGHTFLSGGINVSAFHRFFLRIVLLLSSLVYQYSVSRLFGVSNAT